VAIRAAISLLCRTALGIAKTTESHGKRLLAKVATKSLSSHVQTRGFAVHLAVTAAETGSLNLSRELVESVAKSFSQEIQRISFVRRIAAISTISEEPTSAERFPECLERCNLKNVWFVSGLINQRQEARSIAAQHATDWFTLSATARA
jgi:hypothetical protein